MNINTVKCEQFDKTKLSFTAMNYNNRNKYGQFASYPKYEYNIDETNKLIFETDWITLTTDTLSNEWYNENEKPYLKVTLKRQPKSLYKLI